MLNLVTSGPEENQALTFTLDEIVRIGAQKMLEEALHLEVADYIERHNDYRDNVGRALVARNGKANERKEYLCDQVSDQRDVVSYIARKSSKLCQKLNWYHEKFGTHLASTART